MNETMVYNARFWWCSWGLDYVLVLVAMAYINKFWFWRWKGGTFERYTRFHKGRYFPSVLLNPNVMGIIKPSTYLRLNLVVSFPAPPHLLSFLSFPDIKSRSLRHLWESPTKFLAMHSHRTLDPGWILCLWIAAYVLVVFVSDSSLIHCTYGGREDRGEGIAFIVRLCSVYSFAFYQLVLYQSLLVLVCTIL